MTEPEALRELEEMNEADFARFWNGFVSSRARLLITGGMADWREVLPKWYIKWIS